MQTFQLSSFTFDAYFKTSVLSINPNKAFENVGNQVDLPLWQKYLIDKRLVEYQNHPENIAEWSQILEEFDKEDELI